MCLLLTIVAAHAEPSEELTVEGQSAPSTAATVVLDREDIDTLPARSAQDLLEALPGLHLSSHGGHGKAPQYFLRGFDAVHGADLAAQVEGVPLNEPSQIHGHGYLDLHLLPPRLISGLELRPGPFQPSDGDLAVAGIASFRLGLEQPGLWLGGGLGTDGSGRQQLAWRPKNAAAGNFALAELDAGGGGGSRRWWRQARVGLGLQGRNLRAWLLAMDSRYASPGVLRADDLQAGQVDALDAYPVVGGGRSRRVMGALTLSGLSGRARGEAGLWAGARGFAVEQNYSGFLVDPQHGDGSRQAQHGLAGGGRAEAAVSLGRKATIEGGIQVRADSHHQVEQGIDLQGETWEDRYAAEIRQAELGVWAGARLRPVEPVELRGGGRLARLGLSRIEEEGAWSAWAPVFVPRGSMTLFPDRKTRLLVAAGRGYRSPEARGLGGAERAPVTLADAVEFGVASEPHPRWSGQLVGFATRVDNEVVFDHLEARFVATGATRRLGLELVNELRVAPWAELEAQLTLADGAYSRTLLGESTAPIPYAPRLMAVGLARVVEQRLAQWSWTGGLRGWLLGPRPLPGGFASRSTGGLDLSLHLDRDAWSVDLDLENLLGAQRDGEFVFASAFDRQHPASELPVLHLTMGGPRVARLEVGRVF